MRRALVPRAELTLIVAMLLGFVLVLQTWSFDLYRAGLVLVLGATLLNIAVGNLPRDAAPVRAMLLFGAILAAVAAVFAVGVVLVPTLAAMGQDG